MTIRIVELDRVAPQPWRNGLGRTRELLAWSPTRDADAWAVRVSVADIEADVPFSSFPGVDRAFAVLEGDGVQLEIDGTTVQLRAGDEPLVFAGESAVRARLVGGPTRDLNLMVRRRTFAGTLQRLDVDTCWRPSHGFAGVYTHHAAHCDCDDQAFDLPARSLLWLEPAPAALSLRPPSGAGRFDALGLVCTPRSHR